MLKKSYLKLGAFVGSLPVLFLPFMTSAALKDVNSANTAQVAAGLGSSVNTGTELPKIIGNLISGILGILGIILVLYIVQAGIMYMTAGGDPAKVDKAKKMITQAVVGMIIIVAAFSISNFVISTISTATA